MAFKITQSGQVGRSGPRTFKASMADLTFQARHVAGFGRGVLVGFLAGLVIGATALGWLSPYLSFW